MKQGKEKTAVIPFQNQVVLFAEYLANPVSQDEFFDLVLDKIMDKSELKEKIKNSIQSANDAAACVVESTEEREGATKMLGVLKEHKDGIEAEFEPTRKILHELKSFVLTARDQITEKITASDKTLRIIISDFDEAEIIRIEKEKKAAIEKAQREEAARIKQLEEQKAKAAEKGNQEKVEEKEAAIKAVKDSSIPELPEETTSTRNEIHIENKALFYSRINSIQKEALTLTEEEKNSFLESGYNEKDIRNFKFMLMELRELREDKEDLVFPMSCFIKNARDFDRAVQNLESGKYEWGFIRKVPGIIRAKSKR